MNRRDRLNLYKEMHYFELNQREKLITSLAIPFGIASLLFGLVAYYVDGFPSPRASTEATIFVVMFVLGTSALLVSLLFLVKALLAHKYHYLADAVKMETHHKALVAFCAQAARKPADADGLFEDVLLVRLSTVVASNSRMNGRRGSFRQQGIILLLVAGFFLVACVLPYKALG